MSNERFRSVLNSSNRQPVAAEQLHTPISEIFAADVLSHQKLEQYLSDDTYEELLLCIDEGRVINRKIAFEVAKAMKTWAMQRGVTHYTHWFQPLTDTTAEKHESFLDIDERKGAIESFSGKLLIQQEPDASSFPNGGLRNTFEARGYTAWDPSSPAFIVDDTLCIPTLFIAYTADALDYKTPLLRSIEAVDKAATETAQFFHPETSKVISYLGWEQEYFLVDQDLYTSRPDLALTGRTLLGHESAKNQQLEDHYFGSIPPRVQEFMKDLEIHAYRLGIPLKARHNEVAPNQFELAPIYEECNIANDHNQLIMMLMHRVAQKHHFKVLLHEKPFQGINGSGKHCNWSLGTNKGINLFSPGKDKASNLRFICFIANILKAVKDNDALLKASVSTATNQYRLGGHEAPPTIISSFLGTQVSRILRNFAESSENDAIRTDENKRFYLGVGHVPELLLDNTDRNRTSPFAFTGNRFEFRALGSSANCAAAMHVLNTVVAYQLRQFNEQVASEVSKGKATSAAIFHCLQQMIAEVEPVHFDGNGYSMEWLEEAKKRGLNTETSVPKIYDAYTSEKTTKAFMACAVLSQTELQARNEVKWEIYSKKMQIESRVLGDLSLNHIIPVCIRYQTLLLENVTHLKNLYGDAYEEMATEPKFLIEKMARHINATNRLVHEMIDQRKKANALTQSRERAIAYDENVRPFLDEIRYHIDKLELIVDNTMWPLPKYRELLFIR